MKGVSIQADRLFSACSKERITPVASIIPVNINNYLCKCRHEKMIFVFNLVISLKDVSLPSEKTDYTMLIIDSKDCENIDKALKKYKKKYEKAKTLLQLRERQSFTKPSIKRRGEVLKAIYKQKIFNGTIEA
jgi:small subunit ribosomal protein S21